jgi:hypothetical protein
MDENELFGGLTVPRAPDALKERVFRAAREAPRALGERHGLIDRVWESRTWRWAWAGTVAALLLAHVWLLRTESHAPAVAGVRDRRVLEPLILDVHTGVVDPLFAATWVDRGRPTLREAAQDPTLGS